MKNDIKTTKDIIKTVILIILLFLVIILPLNIIYGDKLFEEQEYKKLLNSAQLKATLVNDFLSQKKDDVIFLSKTDEIKNIFGMELVITENLMKEKVDQISINTRNDINKFLIDNPEMSSIDLQKSEKFRSIAIRPVGETGYTFTLNTNTFRNHLHNDPSRIDYDYSLLENYSESLFNILKKMSKMPYGDGFYERSEDNIFKSKYLNFYEIPTRTNDGVKLSVAATTYLDEYTGSVILADDTSEELISFQENKGYLDLIVMDLNGNVIWTAKKNNEIGTNLITGIYNESLLAEVFSKAKKDLGASISESKTYGDNHEINSFVTSPIFETNNDTQEREIIGVIALKLDIQKIQELMNYNEELTEEIYIVNRDYNHITKLKYDIHSNVYGSPELTKDEGKVISERIDACFRDYTNYYFGNGNGIAKYGKYLNYENDPRKVLGAHAYVLDSEWCVISESSYKDFKKRIPNENLFLIKTIIFILILSLITNFLLNHFIKIEKGGSKK